MKNIGNITLRLDNGGNYLYENIYWFRVYTETIVSFQIKSRIFYNIQARAIRNFEI